MHKNGIYLTAINYRGWPVCNTNQQTCNVRRALLAGSTLRRCCQKSFRRQNQFLEREIFMASGASLCCHPRYGSLVASGVRHARRARRMEFCWSEWVTLPCGAAFTIMATRHPWISDRNVAPHDTNHGRGREMRPQHSFRYAISTNFGRSYHPTVLIGLE